MRIARRVATKNVENELGSNICSRFCFRFEFFRNEGREVDFQFVSVPRKKKIEFRFSSLDEVRTS